MSTGRNTKLTPERQDKICQHLRDGNTRRVAALLSGIAESTFYVWLEKANPKHENYSEAYAEFLEAISRAEAEAEAEHVKNIKTQGIGDYRASVEWLKRRRPADWSEKQQVDVTSGGQAIQISVNINKPEDD